MADQQAPVTITITTHDPEMLANGAEPVETIECNGYVVILDKDDRTQVGAQGTISMNGIASAIVALGRDRAAKVGAHIMAKLMTGEGGPDAE